MIFLEDYIQHSRRVGHTTLMLSDLKTYDKKFLVISISQKHSNELVNRIGNKNAIPRSMQHLRYTDLELPAIIDHSCFIEMGSKMKFLKQEIDFLENQKMKLEKLIFSIKAYSHQIYLGFESMKIWDFIFGKKKVKKFLSKKLDKLDNEIEKTTSNVFGKHTEKPTRLPHNRY